MRYFVACLLLLVVPSSVFAQDRRSAPPLHGDYDARLIGHWLTSAKEDRFGDGGTYMAVTGDGGMALGVRCIQKHLSLGILNIGPDPKPIEKGDSFSFKFRIDAQPIVEIEGFAISDRLIQVDADKKLVGAIRDGKETAVRMQDSGGTVSTRIFDTTGARKAFADLSRECPLD